MGRLESGLELLGHASLLAKACRDCFKDPKIKEMVARRFSGGRVESLYVETRGQGKKKRYLATVVVQWERCALTLFGVGTSVRDAVVSALKKHQAQQTMEWPTEEDLPF